MNNFLKKLSYKAINKNIPIISENTQKYIKNVLMNHKPRQCLEIWTASWFSSIFMGNILQQWWWQIFWFEISYPSYKQALLNIQLSGLSNITLYNMNFINSPLKNMFNFEFDFIFIDAMKKQYVDYLNMILPFCRRNCIIILDDVIKFKSRLIPLYIFIKKMQINYQIIKLDLDDGIMVIKI